MNEPSNKTYTQRKLIITILNGLVSFIMLVLLILSGFSFTFAGMIESLTGNVYIQFLAFTLILSVAGMLIGFPLEFYNSYILEHRFGLSNQKITGWIREELKGSLVGLAIGIPLLAFFYFCLLTFGNLWWIPVGVMYFLFSVLMVRLAPVLLFPLFYQFKPVESESLKERLNRLCERISVRITGIYQFNLSKNTKKANAAFAGLGKSKRILLADTLLENFSEEETEVIFAHEAGHYVHGHIHKLLFTGAFFIFTGLGTAALIYEWITTAFYQQSITDLPVLPVLGLLIILFSIAVMPVQNMISRHFERQADRYALSETQRPDIFIGAMKKLAELNLSDESPHPIVEFLFYSHPSIGRRIAFAEQFRTLEN